MKVFYSWQSDLPNKTNRGLIEDALLRAAKRVRNDETMDIEPVIDRDTQSVPGAADITGTILRKIEEASVFVCDVSIVARSEFGRPCPNPNVLIELGFAMHCLGPERCILVLNKVTGEIEELPFDLRGKKVLAYMMEASEKPADVRELLAKSFEKELGMLFASGLIPKRRNVVRAAPNKNELLRNMISKAPVEDGDFAGWLHIVARPTFESEDMVEPVVREESNLWGKLLEDAARAGRFLGSYSPDFINSYPSHVTEGWRFYFAERPSGEPRRSKYVLDLTVQDDAIVTLYCGRATDYYNPRNLLFESIVAGLTVKFLAFLNGLYEAIGYRQDVDVCIALTGIQGAVPYVTVDNPYVSFDPIEYQEMEYRKARTLDSASQLTDSRGVASRLLSPFFRGLNHGQYDPLLEEGQ